MLDRGESMRPCEHDSGVVLELPSVTAILLLILLIFQSFGMAKLFVLTTDFVSIHAKRRKPLTPRMARNEPRKASQLIAGQQDADNRNFLQLVEL